MTNASRLGRLFLAALAIPLLTLPLAPSAGAADSSWDAQVLGRILAEAPPGARYIRVGDMLLPRAYVEAARDRASGKITGPQTESAFAGGVTLWPGGVVYYDFAADVSAVHQRAFVDAARDWSVFAAVTFVRRVSEPDYVLVQNMPSGGGFSAVGKMGGPQDFMIGPAAWNRGTLNHEIGHVLGMVHEHQRWDRDLYVTINVANLPFGLDGNFVKLTDSDNQGPYDFDSVMHYAKDAFTVNPGQDTIDPLPPYAQYLNTMGNHFDRPLSPLDRQKMAVKYGAGPPQTNLVTNAQDSGPGSLRAAIYYAVDHPGTTITFNIPTSDPNFADNVYTVQPSDVMTTLGAGTTIDGTTQPSSNPNGPSVNLSGLFAQTESFFISGLRITEANCTVRGLILNNFTTYGIEMTGTGATGITIAGCYLGTDSTATSSVPNTFAGIGLTAGAHNNTIGGTTAAARNILSGSATQGVYISDVGTNNNLVIGNYIGLDRTGTVSVPNFLSGIAIYGGAQNNVIGGTSASARNVISGNTQQGVAISDAGTNGNQVLGNYVGTNPGGTAAIKNSNGGLAVFNGAQSNTIGGTAAGAGNLVSGNVGDGIFVGYAGTTNNVVQGNYVGTDLTGAVQIPNSGAGIDLYFGAQFNLIGGTASGAGNLVSGNGGDGIFVGYAGTDHNTIQGNLVGAKANGLVALPNTGSGVNIYSGPQFNLVGGTTAAAANVLSGNTGDGVFLGFAGTNNNTIQGNLIGINKTGTFALANVVGGVVLYAGAASNLIGGTAPGAGNVISGNLGDGVFAGYPGTINNTIAGNIIGLDAAGINAVANMGFGVDLYNGAQGNVVGGGPGARNFITGNHNGGVALTGFSGGGEVTGNIMQGNTIGLNFGGNSFPIFADGITVSYGQNNLIGGSAIGTGNLIAGNGGYGIRVFVSGSTGNTIQRNSIFHSGSQGIFIDPAAAPQSAPVLTSAQAGLTTSVSGSLTSAASSSYRLEFFATPTADTSTSAVGQYFLGESMTTTNGAGQATFAAPLAPAVPGGYLLTCTATNAAGSTSMFSNAATVAPPASAQNDGIPDAWKTFYGLPTGSPIAGLDTDGTGMTNLQKYRAGLNPIDPHSFLRITGVARSGPSMLLTFPSVSGIIYRLERRTDLSVSGWTLVADQIVGTGAPLQITDPQAAPLPQAFYRVSVLP